MSCGLEKIVNLERADVLEISAPAMEGIIVTNPPYGVRLGEQQALAEFYPKLGDVLKKQFSGWRAYLLSADMRLPKHSPSPVQAHAALQRRTRSRRCESKMVEGKCVEKDRR